MMGHREEKGLYLLAAQHLFNTLKSQDLQLQVGLSFFEIYADELYDLLNARTKVNSCLCFVSDILTFINYLVA